jgi:hypothetical protein
MFKRTLMAGAAVAVMAACSSAMAGLDGTTLDLELVQSGTIGALTGPSGGGHDYGTTSSYTVSGVTWHATSPWSVPAFENALWLDFSDFGYSAFLALDPVVTSTFDVTNLAEDVLPGSVAVFLPGNLADSIAIIASDAGSSFTTSWDLGTVLADDPVTPGVVVAWNSMPVPAPGTLALLGAAGLITRRRRRR